MGKKQHIYNSVREADGQTTEDSDTETEQNGTERNGTLLKMIESELSEEQSRSGTRRRRRGANS